MKKRGQITIFIIVAIVVVIAIIGFYFVKDTLFNKPIPGNEVVRNSVVDCIEHVTKNSLYFVSYQGGYNNPPERSFSFSPTFFPYYYYEGVSYMPSIDFIEGEMGEFVEENLGDCIDEVDSKGFEISYSASEVTVEIDENGVNYLIDMPIVLRRDGLSMTFELNEYPQYYDVRLLEMYEASSLFVADQLKDPDYYCLSCISSMASEAGFRFYLFNIIPDVYLVMAYEDKEDPLIFNFVNKYLAKEV